jgi:hypothetical protein
VLLAFDLSSPLNVVANISCSKMFKKVINKGYDWNEDAIIFLLYCFGKKNWLLVKGLKQVHW